MVLSQNSVPLQKLPSSWPLQSASALQPQVFVPLTHLPVEHASPVVQPLPSSQLAALLACTQPALASQLSVVQGLLSSHKVAGLTAVPLHALDPHTSLVVQALPSSHGTLFAALTQPDFGLQLSLVQRFLSSHPTALPVQPPPLHASPWLQALPSSQGKVLFVNAHWPVALLQVSLVHELPSLHCAALPGTHVLFTQPSPTVQALPSVHGEALPLCVQPSLASQASSLQALPSSQFCLLPAVHTPEAQASPIVHTLPSASQPLPSFTGRKPHLPLLVAHAFLVHEVSPELSQVTTVFGLTLHW